LPAEEGMTLIELLVAMAVMSIGIAALVAGFSSGVLSIDRARLASTAAALADKQMELNRQAPFASIPVPPPLNPLLGPDGRNYWMQVASIGTCAIGGVPAYSPGSPGSPASCSSTPANRPVKLLTITVQDTSAAGKVLFSESATFDSSTG